MDSLLIKNALYFISNLSGHILLFSPSAAKKDENEVIFFSRFITLLYYLNDVEDGGETAFPVADNETFDQQVTKP